MGQEGFEDMAKRLTVPARASGVLLIGAAALTGLIAAFSNTEAVVTRGFNVALGATEAPKTSKSGPLISGSEDYWLSRTDKTPNGGRIEPAAWAQPTGALDFSIGDRLTVASGEDKRVLEVVSIAPAPADRTRIEMGSPQVPNPAPGTIVVTCREVGAGAGELVRFVLDGDPAGPKVDGKPARAL
jgi:hypothetical protein